jgi:hypothetical protein
MKRALTDGLCWCLCAEVARTLSVKGDVTFKSPRPVLRARPQATPKVSQAPIRQTFSPSTAPQPSAPTRIRDAFRHSERRTGKEQGGGDDRGLVHQAWNRLPVRASSHGRFHHQKGEVQVRLPAPSVQRLRRILGARLHREKLRPENELQDGLLPQAQPSLDLDLSEQHIESRFAAQTRVAIRQSSDEYTLLHQLRTATNAFPPVLHSLWQQGSLNSFRMADMRSPKNDRIAYKASKVLQRCSTC